MEIVKVTDGQITIPVQIRARLRLESGDSILLVEDKGKIVMVKVTDTFEGEGVPSDGEGERAVLDAAAK